MFVTLISFASCSKNPPSPLNSTPPFGDEGLVAYYSLNGNAKDAVNPANEGIVNGALPCKNRFGWKNAAFHFDGQNGCINFNAIPLDQTDNWSLSAWMNPAVIRQYSAIMCLGHDDSKAGDGFAFGFSAADHYSPGNKLFGVLGGVEWVDSGYAFGSSNVWYHIVMLRRDGNTKFFVNGTQTANTSSKTPIAPTAFTVGSASGIRFFNGMISDIRIYNRALSDSEVDQLYNFERHR